MAFGRARTLEAAYGFNHFLHDAFIRLMLEQVKGGTVSHTMPKARQEHPF